MENEIKNLNLDENFITIVTDDGEKDYEILFTCHIDERNKDYIYIIIPSEDDSEAESVLVFSYDESTMTLNEIEDDAEYDELTEIYNTFVEDEEDKEN